MNIEEAKKKVEKYSFYPQDPKNNVIDIKTVLDIIDKIELDLQKPEIPQFVADWIEEHKQMYGKWDEEAKSDFVFRAINDLFRFGTGLSTYDFDVNDELSEWTTKNAYKFITAILFGYTLEKEKLYKARDKRLSSNQNYLNFDEDIECWFFSNGNTALSLKAEHTRKALEESGFNVFDDDNYEVIEVAE